MLRSVIALLAGFAIMTFTVLVATIVAVLAMKLEPGMLTPEYLGVNLAYSIAAAAFGGYSTAALAPDRPSAHALILSVMVLIMGVSNFILPQPGQERWYLIALIVLGPLGALAGGQLRAWYVRARRPPTPTA